MINFYPKKGSSIAVALSGGVDSGTTAKILVDMGYKVKGFWLWLFGQTKGGGYQPAQATAKFLDIPLFVFDLRNEFKQRIIDYFISSYQAGLTPNPCVVCNQKIKFGRAWELAQQKLKTDYLATGHYARIMRQRAKGKGQNLKLGSGKKYLFTAKDKNKDQTYFLYAVTPKLLDKLVFPIGGFLRNEVETKAKKWQLPVASSQKSVDVCFTDDWQKLLSKPSGLLKDWTVVDSNDNKLGHAHALPFYTLGQRAVFTYDAGMKRPDSPKYFVIKKQLKPNRLIVGKKAELWQNEITLIKPKWMSLPDKNKFKALVKIRSTSKLIPAQVVIQPNQEITIIFSQPAYAPAPGQSAVIYQSVETDEKNGARMVVGGGVIKPIIL